MSQSEKRKKDREELEELMKAIEPAKNEDIARRAVGIAWYWLNKAESQATQIQSLEARYDKTTPCDVCKYDPPSCSKGKPCTMCPAERKEGGLNEISKSYR